MNHAASLSDALGRTRRDTDDIALGAVQRLAATLDQDSHSFRRGSELPESWYAILFGPTARESELGPDGHPETGDFLPALLAPGGCLLDGAPGSSGRSTSARRCRGCPP